MTSFDIAPDVSCLSLGFVNVYFVQNPDQSWVLIDTGLQISAGAIQNAAREKFGAVPPAAILLTHGHLDHAGSARQLGQHWGVPVFVHRREWPFVVGKSVHPPKDPTTGGALANMARLMPWPMLNLTGVARRLPDDGSVPGLPDWEIIETPGHAPGHVSFWNPQKRVLIAGDAFCTADFDSLGGMLFKTPKISRPGTPFTCDWQAAHQSVQKLADLEPLIIGAGHGNPLTEGDISKQLGDFARENWTPERGRYALEPALCNENGIVSLPSAPPDPFARNAGLAASGAAAIALGVRLLTRRR